jgi:hypothetical protein
MLHLSLTPSSLLVAGEVLVNFSLPMFVAALIAAFGDRFKQSVGRLHPRPETPALSLPERLRATALAVREWGPTHSAPCGRTTSPPCV